jgi:transposase InsO family protein
VFGRQLPVRRITEKHWPVALAAEAAGVSRATAYKWLRRYRSEGEDSLADRIDDVSRVAYVAVVPDESGASAARALAEAAVFFAERGVRIERVMTDNGLAYTKSRTYAELLDELGARHLRTRPYRPQTNGKAEAFIKTMLREWAYARLYRSNHERLATLPRWVDFYNHERTHTEIGSIAPMTALVNKVRGKYS